MNQLFLLARIAGRRVAIAADRVDSVVDIGTVTPVPLAARHVRGLAALRSRVVTVIDTVAALGLDPAPEPAGDVGARAVMTVVDGHHYALLVEGVEDVAAFDLRPLSGGIAFGPGWRQAGLGLVEVEGVPVLAVDVAAMVPGVATA